MSTTYHVCTEEFDDDGTYNEIYGVPIIDFKWTTEPPTQDGYYWVNAKIGSATIRLVTYIVVIDGLPYDGMNRQHPTRKGLEVVTHWLGPLPEPKPPVTLNRFIDCHFDSEPPAEAGQKVDA